MYLQNVNFSDSEATGGSRIFTATIKAHNASVDPKNLKIVTVRDITHSADFSVLLLQVFLVIFTLQRKQTTPLINLLFEYYYLNRSGFDDMALLTFKKNTTQN